MKKSIIIIFTTVGLIMGSTNTYQYYYIYKAFGMTNLFYAVTLGNLLAIPASIIYFKHETKLNTSLHTSIILLSLSDALLLVAIKYKSLPAVYTGMITFSLAWLILWSANEYYIMKTNNLQDRAKIVGNRLLIQNITAAASAYAFGKIIPNPALTLATAIILKLAGLAAISHELPEVQVDDHDRIEIKKIFGWVERKNLKIVVVYALTNFAAMLFIVTSAPFIKTVLGENTIGTITAAGFLLQILASRPVTAWATKRGETLLRTGTLLLLLSAGFLEYKNPAVIIATVVLAKSLFTIITLAERHLLFRYSNQKNTRQITMFGRYTAALTRTALSTVTFTGIVNPAGIFKTIGEILVPISILHNALWYTTERMYNNVHQ